MLDVSVETEACPMNLAPTSSSTNMLALGDALAMVLLQARGFQPKDFAELHPSGSLGRQLLTHVTDIMRKGDQLARALPTETISIALNSMKQCKAGPWWPPMSSAGCRTSYARRLCPRLSRRPQYCRPPIQDHMTANPITIQATSSLPRPYIC